MRFPTRLVARALWMGATLLALSFALFGVLAHLPGDPVDLLVTADPGVRPEDVAHEKALRGLDQPWPVQWARWLVGHQELLPPPRAPVHPAQVVEMPPEGPAVVDGERFAEPGVYETPFVVDDGHGQQAVGLDRVLVSPTISQAPTPLEPGLDESERALAGGSEHVFATEAELRGAAEKVGRPLPVAAPRVVAAAAGGAVAVDARTLCPGAYLTFDVVTGPGRFGADGVYRARFDGPGRTAVVFRVTGVPPDADGRSARTRSALGAFVVDHGVVLDPQRFRRGALFALTGDLSALGYSSAYKRPVADLLAGRVQNTLALMVPAFLLSLALAVPLGALAARRRGTLDRAVGGAGVLLVSVPAFWLGLMAVALFAVTWRVLPAGGVATAGDGSLSDRAVHAVLPVSVLALAYAGQWLRYVRAGVKDALPQDFVRTARAKGLSEGAVLWRHALRNALLPLVTVVALAAPQMFAGAVLTETVFSWPGIGRLQVEAVLDNDSYVAIVVFLISAALVMLASLAADLVYAVVDPRVRR